MHRLLNSRAVVDFGRRSSYLSKDDHVRNQARLSEIASGVTPESNGDDITGVAQAMQAGRLNS